MNRRFRRTRSGLMAAAITATITLAGCTSTTPALKDVVGVVLDRSASFLQLDQAMTEVVREQAESVVSSGGTLVVTVVSSDSQGNATPNLELDLAVPSTVEDSDLYRNQWQRAALAEVPAKVEKWLRDQKPGGSDYQGSLIRAARALERFNSQKRLVIVGDGWVSAGALKAITDQQLSADQCRALATEGLNEGTLPSLKGVTVQWYGGGRSPSQVLSPERQTGLQQCWGSLLTELGADLPAGWWAPLTTKG